jgi:uncharacterized protein (DUF362 family)
MSERARVGIISCDAYDGLILEKNLVEGFNYFGSIAKYMKSGNTVFIKPNFIRAPRNPSDPPITNPALLYSLCKIIKDFGAKPVLGDSPAFGTVQRIIRKCGYDGKMASLGVKIVTLKRLVKVKRVVAGNEKTFVLSKDVVECDSIINVPKLKVHGQMGMTMAIKNIFGCVPGKRKAWRHMSYGDNGDDFARMIVETFAAVAPCFTILDGIVAMQRRGPTGGDPAKVGLLFFSEDGLAIERVVAEILEINQDTLPVFRAATALGIGESRLENIEIVGQSLSQIGKRHLIPAVLGPIRFSLLRVIKSAIKNIWISRLRKPE